MATAVLFFVAGLTLAVWVVNIPAVEQKTGISHAVLGGLLLLLGLGSFIGMMVAGPLVDRIGSRRASLIAVLVLIVGVNLPGLADEPWQLGGALLILGLGTGSIDVAMNDQAVIVQHAFGRPIMSSFHAFFSLGGGAGALLGAGLQASGLSLGWSLGTGAVIAGILAAKSYPALLDTETENKTETTAGEHTAIDTPGVRGRRSTSIVLACLAFLMMLSEGTANDWSALHAVDHLGQSDSAAALTYGSFAAAMTIGRFTADFVVGRFGPVKVVRAGSLLAVMGMITVVFSPAYVLTLIGWGVFGLGLSGIVPQIFTAAGNLGGANRGVVISRIVGAGYLGLLAGPAIIGWVSQGIGLTFALVLPAACCVVGVILADRVAVGASTIGEDPIDVTSERAG
ncbi:MFS transporter [Crystallibacter crystallopoietes]|uniref:MFS transporter n=1 Tax=Crystallibacter crystallopoietes TaxID=37928 RepID=UPI00192C0EB4|nr:MFS transporter [Arthrobacter crystallopoietes]